MPIQTEVSTIRRNLSSTNTDQAAQAALVRMSARKLFLIRTVETIVRPFIVAFDRLRGPKSAVGRVNKILILEYWNLGDIVMLSPFLRSLRIQYPSASITLLTSPKAAPLLEHQGLVDRVTTVRVPWAQHYSRWRKYNPFSRLW